MVDMGLSASTLSKRAGLGETYIRDILVGRSSHPLVNKLQLIAGALGCDLADLTDRLVPPGEIDPRLGAFVQSENLLPLLDREKAILNMFRALPTDEARDKAISVLAELLPPSVKRGR